MSVDATQTAVTITIQAQHPNLGTGKQPGRMFAVSVPTGNLMPAKARDAFVVWAAEMFSQHLRDLLTEAADWPKETK